MSRNNQFLFVADSLGRRKRIIYLTVTAVLLFLLAVAALVLLGSINKNRTKEYLQRAQESYLAEDYEGALSVLRRLDTKESDVLMMVADCYEAMGNYERALGALRQMNTSDQAIAKRIQEIEQKRADQDFVDGVTIAGIELHFGERSAILDGLNITDNQMSDISKLYSLDSLSLKNNKITDISSLASLGGLNELDLSENQIRSISALSELKSLRTLNLDYNPIVDCSALKDLPNLISLSVVGTDVEAERLQELATQLPFCAIRYTNGDTEEVLFGENSFRTDTEDLVLSGKNITDISVLRAFRELKILDLSDNEITDLRPLMELAKLESLDISNNQISDLRPLIGLPALVQLDASSNQISETTAVGAVEGLRNLDLSSNPINDYSGLEKLNKLVVLKLTETKIPDAALLYLYPLHNLQSLDLQDNEGLSDKEVGALKSALPNCSILTSELIYEIDFFGHVVHSDVKKLSYPSCGLSDLSGLERLTKLEELDLSGNEIMGLYPFELTPSRLTIKKLNLANNDIRDVASLSALTAVEELDLSGNQLVALNGLQGLTTLRTLKLTGNPVSIEVVNALREGLPACTILF